MDYFHGWEIVRATDSLTNDYSRETRGDQEIRVNVTATCYRPCSLLSRTTSVSISEKPARGNKRFIELLKAELDRKGIHCVPLCEAAHREWQTFRGNQP